MIPWDLGECREGAKRRWRLFSTAEAERRPHTPLLAAGVLTFERSVETIGSEMKMSVSSIVNKDNKREIYVLFSQGERSAEGRLSDYKMINSKGFTPEEVAALETYMRQETDTIVQMAKNVNVMDAFLNG